MNLTFRYQFILTPAVIVVILGCLVAYTLFELADINQDNETTRQWEVLTDRIQTAIASANRLNSVIDKLPASPDLQQDEQLFTYLEQSNILADSLLDPVLVEQLPAELNKKIYDNKQLLREPEKVPPQQLKKFTLEILPALDYQYKLFAAQRRSIFIDTHRKLVATSSRMTKILATGILSCIFIATIFTWWGLSKTRGRLNRLSHMVCSFDSKTMVEFKPPVAVRDELDELEKCFSTMTIKLINVINIEKVMQGAEDERRRIAMEIHDGVLADLTAIYRKLESYGHNHGTQNVKSLQKEVTDIINNLRRTIDDLHPQALDTLGLESALRSYLQRHAQTPGFPEYYFDFASQIEQQLSAEAKLNLFRIVTEAVNNVIKHSHCSKFEVSLRIVSTSLYATVEDNGTGLSTIKSSAGHGHGNITERARLIGANIQWRPARFASGTCFELVMSLTSPAIEPLAVN